MTCILVLLLYIVIVFKKIPLTLKLIAVDETYSWLANYKIRPHHYNYFAIFQCKNGTRTFLYETSPSSEPVLLASSEKLKSAGKEMTFPSSCGLSASSERNELIVAFDYDLQLFPLKPCVLFFEVHKAFRTLVGGKKINQVHLSQCNCKVLIMLNEETELAAPLQLKYGQFNHILLSAERD